MPDAPLPDTDPLAGRLAVRVSTACLALDIGRTRLYELIGAGELESYLDGSERKVTTASLRAYIARRIAERGVGRGPARPEKPPKPQLNQ